VVISGLNGELTAEMVNRFRGDVLERFPRYVIILGGTNDLGWNRTPSDIFHNLAMMYEQAQVAGIIPIAVTVPSFRPLQMIDFSEASALQLSNNAEWQMIRSHIERRVELNGQIREYCVSWTISCVDLFSETAEADSRLLALSYSNDGLHLSTRGYKLLADLLWNQVFQDGELRKVER
jgi:lysophospholipase L1-like esterase